MLPRKPKITTEQLQQLLSMVDPHLIPCGSTAAEHWVSKKIIHWTQLVPDIFEWDTRHVDMEALSYTYSGGGWFVSKNVKSDHFKIHTTDEKVLKQVAEDYSFSLDYLGEGIGAGYVLCGNTLQVFTQGSVVDITDSINDVTCDYLQEVVNP